MRMRCATFKNRIPFGQNSCMPQPCHPVIAICKGMNKYEFIMKYAAQNQRMHLVFYFLHPLKFQTIRIQQEILHSHDDKTFIISPRLLTAIYNDNLLKRVWNIAQRIKLLSLLFFRSHVISNLNVIPLVALEIEKASVKWSICLEMVLLV